MNTQLVPPPPRLSRSFATVPGGLPSPESERLMHQVKAAYANLPFKGRALTLPGGIVAVDDVWRCALDDELEDRLQDGTLKAFSLEAWLTTKVEHEGTPDQKADLRALRDRLDQADDFVDHSGLPNDIMAVVHQPLTEIEVYRDISDVIGDAPVADLPDPDDDDPDADLHRADT
mmetsp:Transcript_5723/g.17264  ORF Transcript_5723/g.17264 Transcript_5723/m.17264 type:complete len:174 (-) Transcript_5723:295-816(-)